MAKSIFRTLPLRHSFNQILHCFGIIEKQYRANADEILEQSVTFTFIGLSLIVLIIMIGNKKQKSRKKKSLTQKNK